MNLVVAVVDGDDGLAKEKAVGHGAGMSRLGKTAYVGVLAHHLRGSGEYGRTFGSDSLDLNDGIVPDVDPQGSLDEIGSLAPGGNVKDKAVATIEPLNRWSDLQGRDDVMPQLCELEVLEKENPPRRSTRVGQMSSYRTGDGLIFQISVAYSTIVRSLENLPEHATLMIAFRHQASGILYNAASSW